MTKIFAHTLVKNEERYLWYAVGSIVDFVDRILLWDTGSTDKTLEIVKKIESAYPGKVDFRQIGQVSPQDYTVIRQKMLEETEADWFLVLDGDEVWWRDSIESLIDEINKGEADAVISPYINLVGDIYHYQPETAGRYNIDGKMGNITIRAVSRDIAGLHLESPYGREGYFDKSGESIQKSSAVRRRFIDAPFFHFTHLKRSTKDEEVMGRHGKYKYELGESFAKDFYYPEVFFRPRPKVVPSVWERADKRFFIKSVLEAPPRMFKRRLFKYTSEH